VITIKLILCDVLLDEVEGGDRLTEITRQARRQPHF